MYKLLLVKLTYTIAKYSIYMYKYVLVAMYINNMLAWEHHVLFEQLLDIKQTHGTTQKRARVSGVYINYWIICAVHLLQCSQICGHRT